MEELVLYLVYVGGLIGTFVAGFHKGKITERQKYINKK